MVRRLIVGCIGLAALTAAWESSAQPSTAASGTTYGSPTVSRDALGIGTLSDAARGKARRGDCVGALASFDAAIKLTIDPVLRRDRGACHERLDNVFPAIDDYRAYLAAVPGAADADDVHARLVRLESRAGVSSPKSSDSERAPKRVIDTARDERDDDDVVLRRGKGVFLMPYFAVKYWGNAKLISESPWNESVGARIGYAMGRRGSLSLDLGYAFYHSSGDSFTATHGFESQLGYQYRAPLGRRAPMDDQFVFGIGVGYHHTTATSRLVIQTPELTYGGAIGRLSIGYRHNFAQSVGIEVGLDGGGGRYFALDGGEGATVFFGGATLGLLLGF